ncbi:MAG: ribulose-phosphate 3-epimerase [Candidatus Limnocylindrus sp.]|jgi:ribulose-phosphate 3-epimerase
MSSARIEIAASILNADLGALRDAVQAAEAAGVDRIHLDIMDGHFVPNLTFGLATVESLRSATGLPFDAHLMILSPGLWATRYVDAGCESVAIHVEAPDQHRATLDAIRDSGGRAGLALDPETPIESLGPFRNQLDFALVMTVKSGFGGQPYRPEAAQRIGEIRALVGERDGHRLPIHVDGGINATTARDAAAVGADLLVVGSALFRDQGPDGMSGAVRAIRESATR